MKVLAIDSSGLTASVAVVEDTYTVAEYTVDYTQRASLNACPSGAGGFRPVKCKKTHSQTLLPMIDEVVKMTDLDLASIDAIAVSGGPGSFTGLRIGSATAKGLGLALNKPLIHVPTVDGLAYQVFGCEDIICPVMDARRKQVYTGIYTFSRTAGKKEGTKEIEPVFQVLRMQMAIAVEDLVRRLNNYNRPVVFLGDGVPVYREMLSEGLKVPYSFAPAYMNRQRAAVIGALGIRYYKAGKYETAMEHQPEYLRQSQAERERTQREKTAKIQVREMKAEDVAAVAEMEYQSFPDPWSQKSILETISNPQTICLLAEKAGKIIGYLFAYIAADEAEIARIAVVREQRRHGAGGSLMQSLEKFCKSRQIRRLLLDVRESNQEARAFYEKNGFQKDGIRRGFYEAPPEDAVLMGRVL